MHISRVLRKNRKKGKITKRRLVIVVVVAVIVVVVVAVLAIVFLVPHPSKPSPLFTVTGKEQPTESVGGYQVTSWNFTFEYNGKRALQNVSLYLDSGNLPFKTVPEVTKGWTYEYIWTPADINSNVTITVLWQGGTENYEFQP
jgi:hypothetical protein